VGLVFLVVIGGMLGWLAAIIARAESGTARMRNILIGIVGALVAGLAVNPLLGEGNLLAGQYSVNALLIALAGSVALLLALNLLGEHSEAGSGSWNEQAFNRGRDRHDAPPP
jgi:uncharacterized membrane protein YeaQ/YmgE (transglycosylase-associated protein family)